MCERTHFPASAVTVTAVPPDMAGEDDNGVRAERVRGLLDAYHRFYYHHWRGEPLGSVMRDMLSDFGHLYDSLPDSEIVTDSDERPSFRELLDEAHEMYEWEIADCGQLTANQEAT